MCVALIAKCGNWLQNNRQGLRQWTDSCKEKNLPFHGSAVSPVKILSVCLQPHVPTLWMRHGGKPCTVQETRPFHTCGPLAPLREPRGDVQARLLPPPQVGDQLVSSRALWTFFFFYGNTQSLKVAPLRLKERNYHSCMTYLRENDIQIFRLILFQIVLMFILISFLIIIIVHGIKINFNLKIYKWFILVKVTKVIK